VKLCAVVFHASEKREDKSNPSKCV
jgi:hypothetical protein